MLEKDRYLIERIIYYCEMAEKINNNHKNSFEEYVKNDEMQLSLDMCIFQIGELSIHISDELKNEHKEVPWGPIKGLRNIEAHEYDNRNYKMIWNTICKDVPDLKEKLSKIIGC